MADNKKIYEIESGDTPAEIALKHGVGISEILEANGMTAKDARRLQVGTKIEIPAPSQKEGFAYHVVQKGETLWGISQKTGAHLQTLAMANDIDPENPKLGAGQAIWIPQAEPKAEIKKGAPPAAQSKATEASAAKQVEESKPAVSVKKAEEPKPADNRPYRSEGHWVPAPAAEVKKSAPEAASSATAKQAEVQKPSEDRPYRNEGHWVPAPAAEVKKSAPEAASSSTVKAVAPVPQTATVPNPVAAQPTSMETAKMPPKPPAQAELDPKKVEAEVKKLVNPPEKKPEVPKGVVVIDGQSAKNNEFSSFEKDANGNPVKKVSITPKDGGMTAQEKLGYAMVENSGKIGLGVVGSIAVAGLTNKFFPGVGANLSRMTSVVSQKLSPMLSKVTESRIGQAIIPPVSKAVEKVEPMLARFAPSKLGSSVSTKLGGTRLTSAIEQDVALAVKERNAAHLTITRSDLVKALEENKAASAAKNKAFKEFEEAVKSGAPKDKVEELHKTFEQAGLAKKEAHIKLFGDKKEKIKGALAEFEATPGVSKKDVVDLQDKVKKGVDLSDSTVSVSQRADIAAKMQKSSIEVKRFEKELEAANQGLKITRAGEVKEASSIGKVAGEGTRAATTVAYTSVGATVVGAGLAASGHKTPEHAKLSADQVKTVEVKDSKGGVIVKAPQFAVPADQQKTIDQVATNSNKEDAKRVDAPQQKL